MATGRIQEPSAPVDLARLRLVEKAVDAWKGQLVDVGGRNTLLYYKDLKQGTLDLRGDGHAETAVDRLLGSHTVRLSDIFHRSEVHEDDPAAARGSRLAAAAKRTRTVRAKSMENLEERGLETLFLAWGIATWRNQIGTATPAAPVLLRQAALGPRGTAGEDFDLSLPGEWEINPTLVHLLSIEFKVTVTAQTLLDLLDDDGAGPPEAVAIFERLCKVAHDVPGFTISDRVVLGNFSYAKLPMVNDLEVALAGGQLATNELLAAIAGDAAAAEIVRGRHPGVQSDEPDMTPPSDEFIVLDADASQSFAINTTVRGGDLVVEGPPGTGKSQTIANLIATLAARGKRTLFVAEKRAAIDAVLERLNGVGLRGLVLDLHDGVASRKKVAQDLARALAAAEGLVLTDHTEAHSRLQRRRDSLRQWRDAVHLRREPWNINIYDVQAELMGLRRIERVTVRLDRDVITKVGEESYRAAAVDLENFAELGGLELISGSNPWRPAFDNHLVTSGDQVAEARDAVAAVADRTLPQTRMQLHRVADVCGLRRPTALSDWADLTSLVEEVASTLERYDAALFDEAASLVEQLAPAERGAVGRAAAVIGNSAYRHARKRIAELAGGRKDPPADMYHAAVAAADQKTRWDTLAVDGGSPQVADDLAAVRGLLTRLSHELRIVVERTGDGKLGNSGDTELADTLDALLVDQATLVKLPELHKLSTSLTNRGLWPLVTDMALRSYDVSEAMRAFRFVWLESLLAYVTLNDPAVGAFERSKHDRNVSEFRDADSTHLRRTPDRVRRAVAERLVMVRDEHKQQSQLIRAEASKKQRHLPLRQLVQQAPDVLTALKPCWAMSPLVVAQMLPPERLFDVVIFDEASQVAPADAIGALLRADRAVVAGDSKQLPPTNFFSTSFGGGADDEVAEEEALAATDAGISLTKNIESVLEVMRALLPPPLGTKTLGWHYRSRDERLIAFSNAQEALYDWSLTTFPGTGIDQCIQHELIPWETGRVGQEVSVSAEVDRVVELVVEHAEQRPDESVGVIAMGIKHANRITERLRQVRLRRPELDRLLEHGPDGRPRPEPLFIKNLERVQGDERDAIILTIGYGKNADGRMMYRFGPLNQEGGERRLNVAITRARSRMTVVSSFGSNDLDLNKLNAEGARMLCRYLQYAESCGDHLGDQTKVKPELNAFERDVRDALQAKGIQVVPQYGCSGYWIDFAAQHPTKPGQMVLAIEADGATYHAGETARDRDRLRQDHLERLGWRFHRIWSTDWFHNRDAEIERAAAAFHAAVRAADGRTVPLPAEGRPVGEPPSSVAEVVVGPTRIGPRPVFNRGLAIGEYRAATLQALAAWIESDTLLRTEDQLIAELMHELGFERRGKNVAAALEQAIRSSRRQG